MVIGAAIALGGVAAGLALRGGDSQRPAPAASASPSSAIVWDDHAREACKAASQDAYALAEVAARNSSVRELQDLAVRQQQLRNPDLIKEWCAKNYPGG